MLRRVFEVMYGLTGDLSEGALGDDLYRGFKEGLAVSCLAGAVGAVAYGKPLLPLVTLSWWVLMFAAVAVACAVNNGVTRPGMSRVVGRSALTLVVAGALCWALWVAAGLPA